MLILGGIVLLFVDRWAKNPRYQRADEFPLSMLYEALEKKMRPVIASTAGIRAGDA